MKVEFKIFVYYTFLNLCNNFKISFSITLGYSSSVEEMHKLIAIEIEIIQNLEKFRKESESESTLSPITRYLNDFKLSLCKEEKLKFDESTKNPSIKLIEAATKNPLFTYRCIRRFVKLLPSVEKELSEWNKTDIHKNLCNLKAQIRLPTEDDLVESIKSLIRLKVTYNISMDSLAAGLLNGHDMGIILDSEDCFEIGNVAAENNFWYIAIDFYEKSRNLLIKHAQNSQNISQVEEKLQALITEHDQVFAISAEDDEFFSNTFQTKLFNRTSSEFKKRQAKAVKPEINNSTNDIGIEASFNFLCRNDEVRDPKDTKNLKCHILREANSKYWLIRPLQIEYLNKNPEIVQVYNFMNSIEIQNLIEFSKPVLERSTYINGVADSLRISSSGFITDTDLDSPFYFINQRIEAITGLKVGSFSSSEDLQVTHYPPGGYYIYHYDAPIEKSKNSNLRSNPISTLLESLVLGEIDPGFDEYGDRIATIMIYLSDVEMGGNTAFPILGVKASPSKGSAVFWYNLYASGSVDVKTLHGGCPVLYGTKWVANKWISSHDQMFRRKCMANQMEDHLSIFQNGEF